MKQQVRNKLHGKAGFTLVELIVVIAVLGILAGIGTVGYSGYVERANKGADQQLIGNIKYALELAYAADPTFNGTDAIILKKGEAAAFANTGDDTWTKKAMVNAFGTQPENQMKLKYGKWGKGAAVAQETLSYFKGVVDNPASDAGLVAVYSGTAVPSFSNDVDDLFTLIRDTAILVNGKSDGSSGAELIQNAAGYTTTGMPTSSGFATAWASSAWSDGLMNGDTYDKDTIDNNKNQNTEEARNFMAAAVANAGVVKARNTALATYMRQQGCNEAVCDVFENYTFGTSIIPMDAVGILLADDSFDDSITEQKNALLTKIYGAGATLDDVSMMFDAINGYYRLDDDGNVDGNIEDSQAYKDGLAYYAMMSTVNTVNNEDGASDDDYWDEMAGAVSLYGSIARGEANLDELNTVYGNLGAISEENAIVVTAMASNGKMVVSVSPAAAMPG